MSAEKSRSGTAEPSWLKSGYSGSEGGNCLEFASTCGSVHVRDSKGPGTGTLTFSAPAWAAFVGLAADRRA